MKLLTKEIERKLPDLYATEKVPIENKLVVAKFFDPCGSWTWYAIEGRRKESGDYIFFGLVVGSEREWGYFSLEELESVKNKFGLGIERDIDFKPTKIKDL